MACHSPGRRAEWAVKAAPLVMVTQLVSLLQKVYTGGRVGYVPKTKKAGWRSQNFLENREKKDGTTDGGALQELADSEIAGEDRVARREAVCREATRAQGFVCLGLCGRGCRFLQCGA